jgi:hypothetical protein
MVNDRSASGRQRDVRRLRTLMRSEIRLWNDSSSSVSEKLGSGSLALRAGLDVNTAWGVGVGWGQLGSVVVGWGGMGDPAELEGRRSGARRAARAALVGREARWRRAPVQADRGC